MNEVKKGYRVIVESFFDYRGHPWQHAVDYYASTHYPTPGPGR